MHVGGCYTYVPTGWFATSDVALSRVQRHLTPPHATARHVQVIRNPLGFSLLCLKLIPLTSVLTFALTFVLMDKRDEYQLVGC